MEPMKSANKLFLEFTHRKFIQREEFYYELCHATHLFIATVEITLLIRLMTSDL